MKHVICVLFFLLSSQARSQMPDSGVSGKDSLILDTIMLHEVVVSSTRPLTRMSGEGIVTRVKGTALERLGTGRDVLGYIPGILNNNGTIEVFGKGTPVIYLNGRRLHDQHELDRIKSSELKEVEVITSPGARYGGSVRSVIRIKTERAIGDGLSFDEKAVFGVHDYLYGSSETNLNYRCGGLDVFGSFEYGSRKQKGKGNHIQNSHNDHLYTTDLRMRTLSRSSVYDGRLGVNYTTAGGNSLGVFYDIRHKPTRTASDIVSILLTDSVDIDHSQIGQTEHQGLTDHLIDGYYSGSFGKWAAEGAFDLLWRRTDANQYAGESTDLSGSRDIHTDDRSRGRMFAVRFQLSRPVWKGEMTFGTELTGSRRKDCFLNPEGILAAADNETREASSALYADVTQKLGNLTARVGLRYEHVSSNYYENGMKIDRLSRTYDKLFPSAMLMLPVKGGFLQLSYDRKYDKPNYSQVSATVRYVNRYTYESGSPQLRPSFTDNLMLNGKYRCLTLTMSYSHTSSRIISVYSPLETDNTATLMRKENSRYAMDEFQTMAQLSPWFTSKVYYPVLACGLLSQRFKTDYLGGTKRFDRPVPVAVFNNIVMLVGGHTLTAGLQWRGSGNSENVRIGETWQLNLSATKTFGSGWELKGSVTDVFNSSRRSNFRLSSGQTDVYIRRILNNRSVELSVRYRFNASNSKYRGMGAGKKEQGRL